MSRDVRFYESIYPYHIFHSSTSQSLIVKPHEVQYDTIGVQCMMMKRMKVKLEKK